jgi:hypothetical protein
MDQCEARRDLAGRMHAITGEDADDPSRRPLHKWTKKICPDSATVCRIDVKDWASGTPRGHHDAHYGGFHA